MNIRIECSCGTRYAFDSGAAEFFPPGSVLCPSCGQDGAGVASELLRQHQGQPAPVATAAFMPTTGVGAADAAEPEHCHRHRGNLAASRCVVCGKPMCTACLRLFGHVCSPYCQTQAQARGIALPAFAGTDAARNRRVMRKLRFFAWGLPIAAGVTLLAWAWYAFVGSRPKVWFAQAFEQRGTVARWIGDEEVLILNRNRLSRVKVASGAQAWTMNVPSREATGDEIDVADEPTLQLRVVGDRAWVIAEDLLAGVGIADGQLREQVPLPSGSDIAVHDAGVLVVTRDRRGQGGLIRLTFADGVVRTQTLAGAASGGPMGLRAADDGGQIRFIDCGASVAEFRTRLLEARSVMRKEGTAPKPIRGPDLDKMLDDPKLRAGSGSEVAAAAMRPRRKDGEAADYEDQSRYEVTLKRHFAPDAAPWSGEVIGRPAFLALPTVDALVAGTNLHVFSKQGKLLWTASLKYPIPGRALYAGPLFAPVHMEPCLEIEGNLVCADKGGVGAFDLQSGALRWRSTAVGATRLEPDGQGAFYVSAAAADEQAVRYSQFDDDVEAPSLVLKLDAKTGRVLWRTEGVGTGCRVSGRFVYTTRAGITGLDMARAVGKGGDVEASSTIYRLHPATGKEIWRLGRASAPTTMDLHGNRLLLSYASRVQAIRFIP